MKKIFFVTLLVISIPGMGISQIITFDKTISSATQVWQSTDGGYILNDGLYNTTKTNQYGYIEWQKGYQLSSGSYTIPKLIKTLDGGYATVGSKLNGSLTDIWFIKLDQNFDTVWTRTYGAPEQREAGKDLIQLPDSSYIISSIDYSTGIYLRKINVNGNLTWSKKVSTPSLQQFYIINLENDNFLFGRSGTVIKFNSNADTIWIKNNVATNKSFITNDGHILLSTSAYLQKLNMDGIVIWQILYGNIESFVQSIDNNYILLQRNPTAPFLSKIIRIDTNGNVLSEFDVGEGGSSIINTADVGFAIAFDRSARFLKTNSNFNYTAINLKSPRDGEELNTFTQYSIIWMSNNVNYINIDYSTDNQTTWNNIISYYPASAETFIWSIPNISSNDLFIKISDSFNPDVYDRSDPPQSVISYKANDYIEANEIFMWVGNNGMNSHDPRTDGSGFYWPGGEDATIPAIFADGLVWGGKVNGEIRVNGSTYRHGLTPGYILPSGLPSDPTETKSKIFKLKKDWQYLPPGPERDKYEFDFINWPVDVGAPWEDNDGNGIYTPGIDNPKIFGDETLFFVANDLDTATSLYTYGSNPMGLEFQVTTFGYDSELLKDVVFKKYKIINKSPGTINDMYFTYWADDDLGDANDDFTGFDSTLNMGYCYNSDNDDYGYYGTPPPAVGHMIVQGPIIPAASLDSARYGNGWRKGFKNLGMTATGLIVKTSKLWPNDPDLGVYEGTLQFYNMVMGLQQDGSSIINPISGQPTIWPLCGDPVTGTGWYEGTGWPGGPWPGDRRYHVPTGPFNMAPNDTQEVVIAFLMKKGTDNINSIAVLKDYAAQIQHWYDNDFVTDVYEVKPNVPTGFSLSQNYPNPFNPVTTIKYTIPTSPFNPSPYQGEGQRERLVTLKVYDLLGSEVATLVKEEQNAGSYNIDFNASHLASGIYFYQLKTGSFVETKKMILLK